MSRQEVLETLAQFHQNRRDEFGIVRIGIFGSTARDTASDQSDVDVVVELSEPDLLRLVGIKQELEALLDRPVDIVRYRKRMNHFRKRRIEEEAVYVG
ncbi:MAG: nucleotidyltransferase domain-containing protein [Anaerolineales bacterium]|nr:nucleotidyltransferase domain-containing protein [Anaerolineales bacterium]